MFREITRKKQAVSREIAVSILKNENGWDINFISVIVFGKIEIITEKSQIENICRRLSYKFTSDEKYIEHEIEQFADNTLLLCLTPECITGKKVNEA